MPPPTVHPSFNNAPPPSSSTSATTKPTSPSDTDLSTAISSILSTLGETTGVEKVKTAIKESYPNWTDITSKRVRLLLKTINTIDEEYGIEDRMGMIKEDVKQFYKEKGNKDEGSESKAGGKKQRVKREKEAKAKACPSSTGRGRGRARSSTGFGAGFPFPPFATRDHPYYRGEQAYGHYDDEDEYYEEEEEGDSDDDYYDDDEDEDGYYDENDGDGGNGGGDRPFTMEEWVMYMALRGGRR